MNKPGSTFGRIRGIEQSAARNIRLLALLTAVATIAACSGKKDEENPLERYRVSNTSDVPDAPKFFAIQNKEAIIASCHEAPNGERHLETQLVADGQTETREEIFEGTAEECDVAAAQYVAALCKLAGGCDYTGMSMEVPITTETTTR